MQMQLIDDFGRAIPPASINPPSPVTNHVSGMAIDRKITRAGTLRVRKDGIVKSIPFMPDVNRNLKLHNVGRSYGVIKLSTDAPHWSLHGS